MIDIEKVKKGLECCSNTGKGRCESSECPYWIDSICCIDEMQSDALALLKEQQQQIWEFQDQVEYLTDKLKEQEAVEPILDSYLHKRCPSCRTLLQGKYCHECGRSVK